MGFVTVGSCDDVVEGEITAFTVGDREVAATRVDGVIRAFSDVCTHRRCNFSTGADVEGSELTCECHGAVFDLVTGAVLGPPATDPLPVFQVREVDGRLEIEV